MDMEVRVRLDITMSKVMAYLMLIMAFIMDVLSDRQGTVFMFSVPFVVFLITGKQYFDSKTKA